LCATLRALLLLMTDLSMPEVFLEFLGDAPPWLLLLLIPLYFWGKLNHDALHNRATHPESFERTIGWLRENNLGLLYLKTLGWVLDAVSSLIGDRRKFNSFSVETSAANCFSCNFFGFNPFTLESYKKCLQLAFIYPFVTIFISWALLDGQGKVDGFPVFMLSTSSKEEKILYFVALGMMLVVSLLLIIALMKKTWIYFFVMLLFFVGLLIYFDFNLKSYFSSSLFLFFTIYIPLTASVVWPNFSLKRIIIKLSVNDSYKKSLLIKVNERIKNDTTGVLIFSMVFSFGLGFEFSGLSFNPVSIFLLAVIAAISFDFIRGVSVGFTFLVSISILSFFSSDSSLLGKEYFYSPDKSLFLIVLAHTRVDIYLLIFLVFFSFIIFLVGASFALIDGVILELQSKLETKKIMGAFLLLASLLFLVFGYYGLNFLSYKSYLILILFWLLLPLVNAPIDWLSLGVTRGLLQAVRIGRHSSRMALGFALADLVLALAFLFLITAVLVGVTALGNSVSGKTLVDIGGILQDVRCEPSKVDHWWIYFMLLSTLVPTLIHFALAGGAATLWIPRLVRLWLADGLERDQHKTFLAWLYLTFMPVLGFVVVPGALLYFLWWLVTTHDAWLGTYLLDWADMLAGREAGICEATLK
jgi:hypothetical protein